MKKQEKKEQCNCNENCQCKEGKKHNDTGNCHNEKETIKELNKRIKELEDNALRSQAELLNYRKRKDEETSRILKYAEEDIEMAKVQK